MAGRECYHCKQGVEEGEAHDCWTTTEGALTADLSEDLRDALGAVATKKPAKGAKKKKKARNSQRL